jgi:uncharacterized protein (TIRG00374 family)
MIFYVDLQTIVDNLRKISFLGLFLFALVYTLSFIFRSYKLKIIFQGINLNLKYSTIYCAIGAGWAINEITPAKLGDLAKIEYIHQKEPGCTFSKCLCGVIIDRVIDLIILFSISCFALLLMYINNVIGTANLELQLFIGFGALILGGALVFSLLLFFRPEWILNKTDKLPKKLREYFKKFLKNFIEGVNDFRRHRKKILLTLLYNIPTWFFESLTLVIFFYLVGFEISFLIIILAQILTFFTKTIPLTPGGWVISEIIGAVFISIFYPYIPYSNIISLFILDHIIRVIYVFIYGGISVISINFKFRETNLNNLIEKNTN